MNMTAALTFLVIATLAAQPATAPSVGDFDEKKDGYEFIYHDSQNLIITIHGSNCYFSEVPDNYLEYGLVDFNLPYVHSARDYSERYLINTITDNKSDVVHPTTLEAMRDKYKDLLADFHCLGKNIFEMVFSQVSGSHHGHSHHGNSGN